jgi:ribosomal protein S14
MLYTKIKDEKNRKLFNRLEKRKLLNVFVLIYFLNKQNNFCDKEKIFAVLKSFFNEKHGFKYRLNRRCVISNRGRGNLRNFGFSRMCFRELVLFGLIPGYSKAVW